MSVENLKFDITLSGTNWGKLPQFSIWLDNEKITSAECDATPFKYSFNRPVTDSEHKLIIRLENKDQRTDTLVVNGQIVNDMLLNIQDISINDISLDNLLWTATYQLDLPQTYQNKTITELTNCVNLGWNGSYIFKFSSPFYIWLLEKL